MQALNFVSSENKNYKKTDFRRISTNLLKNTFLAHRLVWKKGRCLLRYKQHRPPMTFLNKSFLPARVFFFCRNQEPTVIKIFLLLISMYIPASFLFYFLISSFYIQRVAELGTTMVALLYQGCLYFQIYLSHIKFSR